MRLLQWQVQFSLNPGASTGTWPRRRCCRVIHHARIMPMKLRAFYLIAGGAFALATAACSSKAPDAGASDAASDMAISDPADDSAMASPAATAGTSDAATFVADGMKSDNSEVKVAKLAASKATAAGVRDFATMLATDHAAHKQALAKLGGTMDVAATDATTPDGDALYAKLQGLSGADFDMAFVNAMIANHQKGIAKYQAQADGNGPAALVALARETVPKLKHHLETAQSLAK
jgi:putative membrane protein